MDGYPSPEAAWLATIVAVVISIRVVLSREEDESGIPWAPGAVPVLGHALKYRRNPARFLLDARATVGDVFRLNLAGKRMVIACGPRAQRAVAAAPESIMSARAAVAAVGFEEMLGCDNVRRGTDLHKGIVKGLFSQSAKHDDEGIVLGWIEALRDALKKETLASSSPRQPALKVDFMVLVRTVTLRAVIEYFIGPFFLSDWREFDFIEEYMKFQDDLEDATAKSAVMPRALALPLLLWPLRRRRLRLERIIRKRLEETLTKSANEDVGFWLSAVKDDRSLSLGDIAHFIVGLLFAGHKNPAIGAAQAYLMLRERGTSDERESCARESRRLLSDPSLPILQKECPLLNRLCLETLRLTAHSIGGLRVSGEDFPLDDNNLVIPSGSTVALAHIPTSLDAEIWKDPNVLNLDIASSHRPEEMYDDDYAFTVFSHGVHRCPGRRLAMVMLPCTVAILLTEYAIELPDNMHQICFERATLAQRAGQVIVAISKLHTLK